MAQIFKVVGGTPQNTSFGVEGVENVVDPTFGAQRVSLKPTEWISQQFQGGHYQVAFQATLGAAVAANSPIVSFRWAAAGAVAIIKRIQFGWTLSTALTAPQLVDFDAIKAQSWTVADTGGTVFVPSIGTQKKRTMYMNNSQLTSFNVTTGAALTAGTRSLDQNPFAILPQGPQPAANTIFSTGLAMSDLYNESEQAEHPQIFQNLEGFIIRNVTATPAAGAIRIYGIVKWVEAQNL